MEIVIAIAVFAGVIIVIAKAKQKKSPHSNAQMLRFASSAATDILSSNWDHDEYYGRMYKYASAELASNMFKNKSLLNNVLDERRDLLGTFSELKELELRSLAFQIWSSHVYEVEGRLCCANGIVPIVILVNAAKNDLSLDGIKLLKNQAKLK